MSTHFDKLRKTYEEPKEGEEPLRKYYYVGPKETFEELGDGRVRVTDAEGRHGIFRWTGEWLEGDITQANLHMLVWTGGPRLPKPFRYHWVETPVDIDRPSGWPELYETVLDYQMGHKSGPSPPASLVAPVKSAGAAKLRRQRGARWNRRSRTCSGR